MVTAPCSDVSTLWDVPNQLGPQASSFHRFNMFQPTPRRSRFVLQFEMHAGLGPPESMDLESPEKFTLSPSLPLRTSPFPTPLHHLDPFDLL